MEGTYTSLPKMSNNIREQENIDLGHLPLTILS